MKPKKQFRGEEKSKNGEKSSPQVVPEPMNNPKYLPREAAITDQVSRARLDLQSRPKSGAKSYEQDMYE